MAHPLLLENVWLQQQKFEDAEKLYRQLQAGTSISASSRSSLAGEIALARQEIQNTLNKVPAGGANAVADDSVLKRLSATERRLDALEKENKELRQIISKLSQVSVKSNASPVQPSSTTASKPALEDDDDDDDIDLFDDDEEEDEEAAALRQKRLQEYAEKKAKKPALIAKSSVTLDVKPWSDETDMKEMERCVRTIEQDGLLWGASKLVPVGYGIKKLVIVCVIEDLKVSVDELSEKITDDFEELVQSVDIAAFSKI